MNKQEVLSYNLSNIQRMAKYTPESFKNPVTIQEKLRYLNIMDVNPLKWICADKLLLKKWSKDVLGEDISVPTLGEWDDVNDIDFGQLPNEFIIKCNHGSGMNIIVRDKESADIGRIKGMLNHWMNTDYAFVNGFESHYHWIYRKVLAEPLLKTEGRLDILDYKINSFNGVPKFVQIVGNRSEPNKHLNYYDLNWTPMDVSRIDFPANPNIVDEKPAHFDKMVNYATQLSQFFKYVRVDFYEVDGKIYLGELTFVPGVAIFEYKQNGADIEIGNMLQL